MLDLDLCRRVLGEESRVDNEYLMNLRAQLYAIADLAVDNALAVLETQSRTDQGDAQ